MSAKFVDCKLEGSLAGEVRSGGKMTFVGVENLVPGEFGDYVSSSHTLVGESWT